MVTKEKGEVLHGVIVKEDLTRGRRDTGILVQRAALSWTGPQIAEADGRTSQQAAPSSPPRWRQRGSISRRLLWPGGDAMAGEGCLHGGSRRARRGAVGVAVEGGERDLRRPTSSRPIRWPSFWIRSAAGLAAVMDLLVDGIDALGS